MNYRDVIPQKYLDKFDAYNLNVAGYGEVGYGLELQACSLS